jgi:hypothetical protein
MKTGNEKMTITNDLKAPKKKKKEILLKRRQTGNIFEKQEIEN